eukprot:TRINITY_DN323_c0_g1_i1.p1 TRINITY_DN323_c0_g1~~TRINITY_DN323_c0_g1_i1.p1  ORF type:complete len:396 (+),score=103.67 TRINITY_DN323_c0_g1_i1:197-1384(+)
MDDFLTILPDPTDVHESSEDELLSYHSEFWNHTEIPVHTTNSPALEGLVMIDSAESEQSVMDYTSSIMPHQTIMDSQPCPGANPRPGKRKADPMLPAAPAADSLSDTSSTNTYTPTPTTNNVPLPTPSACLSGNATSTELAPPNTLCPPFEESALAAAQKKGLNPEGTLGQFLTSITEEERQLIENEGVPVPLSGSISAAVNKELKRMRRKVKNKLSAKDSRRRRKEYVSQIEQRNRALEARVKALEKEVAAGKQGQAQGNRTSRSGQACAVMVLMLALSGSNPTLPSNNKANTDAMVITQDGAPLHTVVDTAVIPSESKSVAAEPVAPGKPVVSLPELGLDWLPSVLASQNALTNGVPLAAQDKAMLGRSIADSGAPLAKRACLADAVVLQLNK